MVLPVTLREAIAEAIAGNVKAYDLPDVCGGLGLAPGDAGDAFQSKRVYVLSRLRGQSLGQLADIARRVVAEYGGERLGGLLQQLGAHGVQGELQNLIFAANGPKPRIVLRDAINNVIQIVEHAEHCLVYDRPLEPHGLTWGELVDWWAAHHPGTTDRQTSARALYQRLAASLASEPERLLFRVWCARYAGPTAFATPALIPQVYLHYDPYTQRELAGRPGELVRQRMDFLLLLPNRARVVLEVDGIHHYASEHRADPARYAAMVAEDRRLRLAGYEVFRFGGHELQPQRGAAALLEEFFTRLLSRHSLQ